MSLPKHVFVPGRPRAQSKKSAQNDSGQKQTLADALRDIKKEDNSLLSPVHIPEDPHGLLNEKHPAATILANSGIVIQRQLELMNVMIGFEQANKYVILDPQGNHVGFIAEQDNSIGRTMARQMFSTHRSFTTHVFDKNEREVLRFHRPFSWVSSRIGVYDPVEVALGPTPTLRNVATATPGSLSTQVNQISVQISPLPLSQMRIIGEAHQQWAPLRRKYNLYLFRQSLDAERKLDARQIALDGFSALSPQQLQVSQAAQDSSRGEYTQFAYVDEPFLSWDFSLRSAESQLIGSVNRNWGGIGRELFTDTGVYALRMDAAGITQKPQLPGPSSGQTNVVAYEEKSPAMTLDQRAVMLATAVSIDFDYFSRHSSAGGGMGWMPLWFPMGGGEAAASGEVAEGAAAAEEASEGSIIKQDGAAAGGTGMGTMAGYEAMQKGHGRGEVNDASSTAAEDGETGRGDWGDWGPNIDPWDNSPQGSRNKDGGDGGRTTDAGDAGEGGGGGFDVDDFFGDL
ncbi:MAG: hypothetical protein Q9211_001019 [Gyalolechia sp. 1 TL-2023]